MNFLLLKMHLSIHQVIFYDCNKTGMSKAAMSHDNQTVQSDCNKQLIVDSLQKSWFAFMRMEIKIDFGGVIHPVSLKI